MVFTVLIFIVCAKAIFFVKKKIYLPGVFRVAKSSKFFSTTEISILYCDITIYWFVSACDTTLFPGNPGANSLVANVPSPPVTLPVAYPVAYSCTSPIREIFGNPTSNQCDGQGAYGPVAICALGELSLMLCNTYLWYMISRKSMLNIASSSWAD